MRPAGRISHWIGRAALAAGLLLAWGWGCGKSPTEPDEYAIEYRVEGTAPVATITWLDADEAVHQEPYMNLPWRVSFTARKGWTLYGRLEIPAGITGSARMTVFRDSTILARTPEIAGAGAVAELP